MQIHGIAYVPGCVRGVLHQGARPRAADDILLITQAEIAALSLPPAGIIVVDGAPFSHGMIGLLGLGVPTIIIAAGQARKLNDGMRVELDGSAGILSAAEQEGPLPPKPEIPTAGEPTFTADGASVYLCASVRSPAAARKAVQAGAAAIGLVRSEFFIPEDGSQPDKAYFRQAFADLCRAAAPLPVTIRLLDAAADKHPAWLPRIAGFGEALGLQGARLFGDKVIRKVVEAQLTAIAALASEHELRVLIPYLVRYEELRYWSGQIRPLLPDSVGLGAMVETPAAALDMGRWLGDIDFVAVGCNDLMQCLFAADRDAPGVADYLDPYAPPLYRLLQQMAGSAGSLLDKVRLCGLLSQLQGVLPILIGLGYRRFSVDAAHIPYLAEIVGRLRLAQAGQLAEQVCMAAESRQVRALLALPATTQPPFVA